MPTVLWGPGGEKITQIQTPLNFRSPMLQCPWEQLPDLLGRDLDLQDLSFAPRTNSVASNLKDGDFAF